MGPTPDDLREDMQATLAKLVQVLYEASAVYDRPVITNYTATPSKSATRSQVGSGPRRRRVTDVDPQYVVFQPLRLHAGTLRWG